MAKVLIVDIVQVHREIELPETCPKCKADLTVPSAIRMTVFEAWAWDAHIPKADEPRDSDILDLNYDNYNGGRKSIDEETTEPNDFWCTGCDTPIAEGRTIRIFRDNPSTDPEEQKLHDSIVALL